MAVRIEPPQKERKNFRPLYQPLVILAALLIVTIGISQFGYTLIGTQFSELTEAQELNDQLEAKVSILSDLGKRASVGSESLMIALPERNPALMFMSQINLLTEEENIALTDTEVSAQLFFADDISHAIVSSTVESENLSDILNLTVDLSEYLPYNQTETLKIKWLQGIYLGEIDSKIYWSPKPTTIDSVSQSIQDLNSTEIEVLDEISSLEKPQFSSTEPKDELPRDDPFN
ncbi:hypothetical protein ACFL2C_03405 [Patescibacteria group bacterium]